MDWLQLAGVVGGNFLLDIVLSGDNALVIGVAASRLQNRQRLYAFLIGGAGAIILRIILTSLASVLLNIPLLQSIGAFFLLYMSYKMLQDRYSPATAHNDDSQPAAERRNAFFTALKTIIIADVTMSLDNILAVGALSNGNTLPLVIGLILSIAIILLGSAVIAVIAERLRWLLNIAALILGLTSASMITDDLHLIISHASINWLTNFSNSNLIFDLSWLHITLAIITVGLVLFFNYRLRRQSKLQQEKLSAKKNPFKEVV